MAISLIKHKRIFTTLAKAKELRRYIEPLITKSKTDTTHSRRVVFKSLHNKHAIKELFQEISQKIIGRPGGYTRIIKTGNRLGDNAKMCFIELVDYNEMTLEEKKPKAKTRRQRKKTTPPPPNPHTNKNSHHRAYYSAQIVQLVGFRSIYPEQKTPELNSLLENIPREQIVKVAQVLINLYKNAEIGDMQKFFSLNNQILKEDFNNRFHKLRNTNPNVSYSFCVIQTSTELLKQAFAIPYKRQMATGNKFEENLLKAILVINDKLMDFKPKTENKNSLEQIAELMVVNSFSQKDINNFDYNEVFREIFSKSIDLFEYVSSNEYFAPIYRKFLEKLQIQDYKDYVRTIVSIFGIILQNKQDGQKEQWAGTFHYNPTNDPDKLINTNVLDYISLSLNRDIPLNENEDYKVFRDKPLIKMPDGSYEIVNVGFVLERLFASLYFDFKTIAKELNMSGFEDNYKQSFMEKTLLCKYLEMANDGQKYTALSSEDIKAQYPKNGGEPDYYMRSDKTVILFENKDIMINGAIKEARDFDKIIAEYKNKLLFKTHSNNILLPENKQKPEGIGQLIDHVTKIQNGNVYWDTSVPKDSVIYPVLVIGDSKLLPDGLPVLMQKWYEDNCSSKKVDMNKAKPLIVIPISTLLLYAQEFKENGFECYFEEYYKSIKASKSNRSELVDWFNATVSFSEYMEKAHPKNFVDIYNLYKGKVLGSSKKNEEK
jgi:ribosomal protein L17